VTLLFNPAFLLLTPVSGREDSSGNGIEDDEDPQLAKIMAIQAFAQRVMVTAVLQLCIAVVLMLGGAGIGNSFLPVTMAVFGIYGSFKRHTESVFLFLVLNIVHVPQLIYMFIVGNVVGVFFITIAIADLALFTPTGIYWGFFLYQILRSSGLGIVKEERKTNAGYVSANVVISNSPRGSPRGVRFTPPGFTKGAPTQEGLPRDDNFKLADDSSYQNP
jgi:hypothetical protein